MALTSSEEALVRQLLDQQAAILSLAGNEATITSKLGATKVTLADLTAASSVGNTDLFLTRQGVTDKSITGQVLKNTLQVFERPEPSAEPRTFQSKMEDSVSVFDFMTAAQIAAVKGGTSTNDSPAIQSALDTGRSVYVPEGTYKLGAPVYLRTVGQRLYGESPQDCYFIGGSIDLVRVAASHCEVDHIHFRPSAYSDASPPLFAPIRIYAALAHIHNNRFLAASAGHGTAILLDDVNPETSAIVAGAYIHTIEQNFIGASGYNFKYSVYSLCANNGQQATKFLKNQILGDLGFYIFKGGANTYFGNLLQSATGGYDPGTRVGNGIDLQDGVIGEMILGNYLERYNHAIITRRVASDYPTAHVTCNHYDNNDNNFTFTGSSVHRVYDDTLMTESTNTWKWNFASQDELYLKNREGITVLNIHRDSKGIEAYMLGHTVQESLSYTANGQTVSPNSSWANITGAGDHRTGCFLGAGKRHGQHLFVTGFTWNVEILKGTTVQFNGSAASVTFGNSTGQIATMHLIWNAPYGKWFEVSRALV